MPDSWGCHGGGTENSAWHPGSISALPVLIHLTHSSWPFSTNASCWFTSLSPACDRFQAGGLPKPTGLAAELTPPSGACHRLLKVALGLTPQSRCSNSGSSNRDTKNTKSAHSTLGPRGRTPCPLVSIGWISQLASEPKGGSATGQKAMGFVGWKPGLPDTLLHGPREALEQEWAESLVSKPLEFLPTHRKNSPPPDGLGWAWGQPGFPGVCTQEGAPG